ncbi:hypothetical protein R84B8_02730 [Treponema sp. R8-4-B8]
MRRNLKTLIIAASLALAAIIVLAIYYTRSPVLIVTEESFIELYGRKRIKNEALLSSVSMFRSVKTVEVANDAGDDIVPFAVAEISVKPYCVLFPLRFVQSAQRYKELNPNIPVVVLEGRYPESENPAEKTLGEDKADYFIYKTDINDDFYNLGLAISAFKHEEEPKNDDSAPEMEKKEKIVVFLGKNLSPMKDVLQKGLFDRGILTETQFFNSFSQYSEIPDISCVILAGLGFEYLEKKTGVPVISFTWIDPYLLPSDVVMVINDSPWAQARQAVSMVKAGEKNGLIKSEFMVLNRKKFDKDVVALIKKTR